MAAGESFHLLQSIVGESRVSLNLHRFVGPMTAISDASLKTKRGGKLRRRYRSSVTIIRARGRCGDSHPPQVMIPPCCYCRPTHLTIGWGWTWRGIHNPHWFWSGFLPEDRKGKCLRSSYNDGGAFPIRRLSIASNWYWGRRLRRGLGTRRFLPTLHRCSLRKQPVVFSTAGPQVGRFGFGRRSFEKWTKRSASCTREPRRTWPVFANKLYSPSLYSL